MAVEFETLMVKLKGDITHLKKELDKAITIVGKFDKTSGKQVQALGKSITRLGKNFAHSGQRMGMAISGVGKKMAFLGVAVTGMVALSLREFAKFETGMANIKILLTDNQEAWGQIEEKILQVARTTGTSTEQLTKGYFDIQSAVGDVNESLDIFVEANKLAIAGGSSFAETSKGLVTLMEAYGDSLRGAEDASNLLFKAQVFARASIGEMADATGRFLPLASALGANVEEVMSAFATMTVSIGNVNEASTAMGGVLNGLLKPTTQLQEKAQEWYGTTIQQAVADGKYLDILKRLSEVAEEELGRMMPRIQGIKGLVGVKKSYAKTVENVTKLQEREGIVQDALAIQMDTLARQTAIARENFKAFIREAIAPLVPIVKDLAGRILPDMLEKFKKWKDENTILFETLVKLVAGGGALLIALGGLGMALGALYAGITTLIGGVVAIIGYLVTLGGTLYGVTTGITGLIAGFSGVGIAVIVLLPKIKQLALALWDLWEAQKHLEKAKTAPYERMEKRVSSFRDRLTELNKSYDTLTDREKEYVDSLNQRLATYDKAIKAMKVDGELLEKEKDLLAELTHQLGLAEKGELALVESLVKKRGEQGQQEEAMRKYKESQEELTDVQKGEQRIVQMLTTDYQELSNQLVAGNIDYEAYKQGVKSLIEEFRGMGMKVSEITKLMNQLDRSDPNIDIKLNVLGLQEVTNINRSIREMNQEIVLESLEGHEKEIQSHKFMLENKLDDIRILREERRRSAEEEIELLRLEYEMKKDSLEATMDINAKAYKTAVAREKSIFDIRTKFENDKLKVILGKYEEEEEAFLKLWDIKMNKLEQEKSKKIDVANTSTITPSYGRALGTPFGGGQDSTYRYENGQRILRTGFRKPEFTPYGQAESRVSNQGASIQQQAQSIGDAVGYSVAKVMTSGSGGVPSSFVSLESSRKSYSAGTSYVPKTGTYELHKGERVTGAEQARGEDQPIIIINQVSKELVDDLISPNTIINVISADIVRNGVTRRVIKGVK